MVQGCVSSNNTKKTLFLTEFLLIFYDIQEKRRDLLSMFQV